MESFIDVLEENNMRSNLLKSFLWVSLTFLYLSCVASKHPAANFLVFSIWLQFITNFNTTFFYSCIFEFLAQAKKVRIKTITVEACWDGLNDGHGWPRSNVWPCSRSLVSLPWTPKVSGSSHFGDPKLGVSDCLNDEDRYNGRAPCPESRGELGNKILWSRPLLQNTLGVLGLDPSPKIPIQSIP